MIALDNYEVETEADELFLSAYDRPELVDSFFDPFKEGHIIQDITDVVGVWLIEKGFQERCTYWSEITYDIFNYNHQDKDGNRSVKTEIMPVTSGIVIKFDDLDDAMEFKLVWFK